MTILQMDHKISNYDGWKHAIDSDPIGRCKSGVRSYRIYGPTDDQAYIIIDLQFDHSVDAEATVVSLHKLWGNVEGKIIFNPKTRLLEIMEAVEY